jgi:general secretion pathway protein G
MVVLVIMGLLAGVVTINVRGYLLRARQTKARQDITAIRNALDTYFGANSRYPSGQDGLSVLTKPTKEFPEPLLRSIPKDPWGNDYEYFSSGPRDFEVVSRGADGRDGGQGADADISSNDDDTDKE